MLEGLHPNRPTHIFRITTDERSARAMTELIGEIFDPTETAVAAFETEEDGPWLLEAYFAREPDETAIRDLLRPIVGAEADKGVFLPLQQQDWVKASLEGLNPVRAGRLLIHGSHDRHVRRSNDLSIEIEAALAFGTGHHGTTKSCLLAFVDELKRRRPRHVLDVGTGTGILAFAAAKVLKRPVVAGDIDPEAVRVARENARLNGIAPWMKLYVGPGVRNAMADRPGHFDLIFANILAKPLRLLAPSLARVATRDGILILSGLLVRDVPGVLSAYAAQGWHLERRYDLEGWVALVLRRGGAHPRPRRRETYSASTPG
ncbi:50S ribosomal protein L11 methyltransferase [Microvirga thermotolerans]|uniref:Ribosomal protein L11 methyltransferase n=1 Tax=Microvirga thermotolerans TaxID=2651334 RepID=A0A5P9K1B6_9HYPH|nr:50S ribosomal protein L11 methyltransferase [Microvirga thermotolerans]QFU16004.1 50S ribosomal protein L11 methyltransferase [Microvirga thermotolerans]